MGWGATELCTHALCWTRISFAMHSRTRCFNYIYICSESNAAIFAFFHRMFLCSVLLLLFCAQLLLSIFIQCSIPPVIMRYEGKKNNNNKQADLSTNCCKSDIGDKQTILNCNLYTHTLKPNVKINACLYRILFCYSFLLFIFGFLFEIVWLKVNVRKRTEAWQRVRQMWILMKEKQCSYVHFRWLRTKQNKTNGKTANTQKQKHTS